MTHTLRNALAALAVVVAGCALEVSDEATELAVVSEELFVAPITMSLSAGIALAVNNSAAASPAPWTVATIVTPGAVPVRKNRWKFQNIRVIGGQHHADLVLGPAIPGDPLDANLAALAAAQAQITLRVRFANGALDSLRVNLTP